MNLPFLFTLHPCLATLIELRDSLLDEQVLGELFARWVGQLAKHHFVHHGFATLSEVCRLPPVEGDQAICDVVTGGWVELHHLDLCDRDTLHITTGLVVDLGYEVRHLDFPRTEVLLQLSLQFTPALHQGSQKLSGFLHIEVETVALLLGHEPGHLVLQLQGFLCIVLVEDLLVQGCGNLYVLDAVVEHLLRERLPAT